MLSVNRLVRSIFYCPIVQQSKDEKLDSYFTPADRLNRLVNFEKYRKKKAKRKKEIWSEKWRPNRRDGVADDNGSFVVVDSGPLTRVNDNSDRKHKRRWVKTTWTIC